MDPVIKIMNYRGSVVGRWSVPRTKRQVRYAVEKLLKLYFRCKSTNLLTRELLTAIKTYAERLWKMCVELFIVKPEFVPLIQEILQAEPETYEEEIVMEKMRRHETKRCSLCGVRLVYPAYVVYRKGGVIVKESAPVGIFCLTEIAGKLRDLITRIDTAVRTDKGAVLPFEKTHREKKQIQGKLFEEVDHAVKTYA